MLLLGYCYENGWYTKQNYKKAVYWYLRSTRIGKPKPIAFLFLGQLYQFGHGVKQDGRKAVVLFRRAYRLGVVAATIHLANIYDSGMNNIHPSRKLAIYWYKIAARPDGYGSKLARERLAELLKPTHTK
jgi:TPR repeat protein